MIKNHLYNNDININNNINNTNYNENYNLLKNELEKKKPDLVCINKLCNTLEEIPSNLRSQIWKEYLGIKKIQINSMILDQNIIKVETDLENQKVIQADVERTRSNILFFQKPEIISMLSKILTYYCKCKEIRYKQGMNEVLAPFFLASQDNNTNFCTTYENEEIISLSEGILFQFFYAFIAKFLPNTFVDVEFRSLQLSFRLLRLLLLYHDPILAHFLDQHDMVPEIYATPWFMTLFARNLTPLILFKLWDFIILNDDPHIIHFIAFALLNNHRESILNSDIALLPYTLTSKVTFKSVNHVKEICIKAVDTVKMTPKSFYEILSNICFDISIEKTMPLLKQINMLPCINITPEELVTYLLSRSRINNNFEEIKQDDDSTNTYGHTSGCNYFILDCRTKEEYEKSHLCLSYNVDPDFIYNPEALQELMNGFIRMKGCHFCFLGTGRPDKLRKKRKRRKSFKKKGLNSFFHSTLSSPPSISSPILLPSATIFSEKDILETNDEIITEEIDIEDDVFVTRFVLMFLQKGFQYVSHVQGGYRSTINFINGSDTAVRDSLIVQKNSIDKKELSIITHSDSNMTEVDKIENNHGSLSNKAKKVLETGAQLFSKLGRFHSKEIILTENEKLDSTPTIHTNTNHNGFPKLSKNVSTSIAASKEEINRLSIEIEQRLSADLAEEDDEWVNIVCNELPSVYRDHHHGGQKYRKEIEFPAGVLGILFKGFLDKNNVTSILVDAVLPGSIADSLNIIYKGDILVCVNNQNVKEMNFYQVMDIIKSIERPFKMTFESIFSFEESNKRINDNVIN